MEPLSQMQVEAEIMRLCGLAERVTTELATRARDAAEADAEYKRVYARAFLVSEGKTVSDREAEATIATGDAYARRRSTEALLHAASEAGRNYRAQLEALRSVNANLRPLVSQR